MASLYRLNNVLELSPLFISLGLPNTAFKSFNPAIPLRFFDAVVNAGPVHPDCLWLFKGSDYHRYNLRERKFEVRDRPISDFCKLGPRNLPASFFSGVDTVFYAGSLFPNIYFFFSENTYVRLNNAGVVAVDTPDVPAQSHWNLEEGPITVSGWAVKQWMNANGVFIQPGPMAALHGEGSRFGGQVHFFRHGEYIRHDLRNGGIAQEAVPIGSIWRLPAPFTEHIDAAFYGAGTEAQKIYFFSGTDFVLYDPELDQVLRQGRIEQEFPGFASFMARPQLFLVENMALRTYLGPLQDGAVVDSRFIGPGETLHRVLVIETVNSSTSTVQTSILDQQDAVTAKNFDDRVSKETSQNEGSESYRYHLNADAHADASASGFWGGEVNANLAVQGGSDSLRNNFASSVFSAVSSQVTESQRQQVVRAYSSTDQVQHSERVLSIMEFTQQNSSNQIINIGFLSMLQPIIGLLVLNSVRIAYSDGFNPRIIDLRELPQLLEDVLVPSQSKDKILQFITGELSQITDMQGQKRSLLAEGSNILAVNSDIVSIVPLVAPDGTTETVNVPGIVKAAKEWMNQTRSFVGRNL